ncbi:MAG: L-threonylcarbamoyladenylate synthase [Planctomycetota bacterium]|nr:L-threonylcarbamoyladenylate synthase [Planctomycetota bacterium]
MKTRVVKVRSNRQVAAAGRRAARALKAGKLVGFATETVYGVAAVASNRAAMNRLRKIKSRPLRPFSVHLPRPEDVRRYVCDVPIGAGRLIEKAWPGPVTLVLPAGAEHAGDLLRHRRLNSVLCYDGAIGLRCPDEAVAGAMLSAVKASVVACSANPANEPSPRSAKEVLASLDGSIDLLIDSGPTRFGADSTIVRFAEDGSWKVVRRGVYDTQAIRRFLKRTILFICTGNTCRSAMAAGLAKKLLADRLDCRVSDLKAKGLDVLSAGVFASDGARAAPEAVCAARELGADISRHRSRKLTIELIYEADLVFCMTDVHVYEVRSLMPEVADKAKRLDADCNVPDPIGGGTAVYRRAARQIERALRICLDKEKP